MASRVHSYVSQEAMPAVVMTKEEIIGGKAGENRKRKKTMGRQKIEIKRIDNEEKRQVCFSKRKDGLFKKASDLSVLSGAHVAAVAFSPGGKPFSFGHPSVQALVDRFFTDPSAPAMGPAQVNPVLLDEVSRQEGLLVKALEAEVGRKKALDAAISQAGVWPGGVDGKSAPPDLLAMQSSLEKVQADVAVRLRELMAKEAMMHYTATGTDASGGIFHYPGAGTSMTDGGVSSHHHDQVVMDKQMMTTMGGNVDHALPFAPMMLPPYTHCFDLNHGPCYDHDPLFGMEVFYGTMARSFF